eukprot:TRINITY_DN2900_c0_g1_i2.p1 TRINITY_DN2900_c0_g1~~TRINITY_DN2900_c0_g1_i2.p1  ORF type:complete len:247 (+),score=30.57 TRINITY_DN2900_c0_g1_i2:55-741(+)
MAFANMLSPSSSSSIIITSGARLLPLRRKLESIKRTVSLSPSLQLTRPPPPSRGLQIRAARTESKRASLGFRAPDFEVMFICNHCPFVIYLKKNIVKLANFYMKKGLAVVAISSNSIATHPQDGPEFMSEEAKLFSYPFPYLYDETQDVARAFGAVCTPEFFLFKKDGRRPFELFYHGQFDDSRPSNNVPITGRDLSCAIDCVLSGQPLSSMQKPSVGCSIKWHPEKN